MAIALWFVALAGTIVAAVIATARARARPDDAIARAPFVAIALAHAALVAAAVWVWGGELATASRRDRVRAGAPVELELRAVAVADATFAIGHDAPALVRLPGPGAASVARVERDRRGLVVRTACGARDDTFVVPPGAALAIADCAPSPLRLSIGFDGTRATIAPLGRPPRTRAAAGEVVRVGRDDEPIPALATWQVPAATAEIVAVPADPTDCAAWPGGAPASSGTCRVRAGAFELVAIPLVPDADAVIDRAARAAIAIGAPLVVCCLALALSRRSQRRAHSLARVLQLAALGGGLAALACWRLAWAYRIDVLRDFAPVGVRVVDNELAAALLGAALAGLACERARGALLAWVGWLACAWFVIGLGPPHVTVPRAAAIALSLVAALAPHVDSVLRRLPRGSPTLALGAIGAAALVARVVAPRGVLAKLALAYALVIAGHAALRALFGERGVAARARAALALAFAFAACASYDTGVTVAIAGAGLALAAIVAGHDAIYEASRARHLGVLEREHARVITTHAAFAFAIAAAAIVAAIVVGDRAWVERGALVALHAPLVVAALFAVAAVLARVNGRAWVAHAVAAAAAIALWAARADAVERATAGHGVAADRVAAVVEPGYALLRDGRRFAATAAAWREAALPDGATAVPRWTGEGLFGARLVDPGVVHSIENDYLPVLVAREVGVAGVARTAVLLVALVGAALAIASAAARHASRAHRGRWLVAVVIGTLCVYQPLAALGVLPLTGISWPGLGIDSPSDLWVLVIALAWCTRGGASPPEPDDERVRATPRLRRARRLVIGALAIAAIAGVAVVARSAGAALGRVAIADARIAAAFDYAATIACPWRAKDGALAELVPDAIDGTPRDDATARFDRERRAAWVADRPALLAALPTCAGAATTRWQLARDRDACVATFHAGGPDVRLRIAAGRATCTIVDDDVPRVALRGRTAPDRGPRVRVVSAALGSAALDDGEAIAGARIVRLRAGAPALALAAAPPGPSRAGTLTIADGVRVEATALHRLMLHGDAELFVAGDGGWHRAVHAREVAIDRVALVVAGPPERRVVVQLRPRASALVAVDPLLADDADRTRRTYPYGAALPELGWVNPYDVDRSLGLDGWIHAALHRPGKLAPTCGTLAPPPAPPPCTPSALDGTLECRLALQPELALALAAVGDRVAAGTPAPTRVAYVVLRGDTGELLAQSDRVPGRPPLAYAPVDRAAEHELERLREQRGESDRERVEWNLPIAIGSTFKPIVARAAERAFPRELSGLELHADGNAGGCRAHRGIAVAPLLGHCPPSSLAGAPTSADVHDFLARSPNWFQAALGLVGLALPDGRMTVDGRAVALGEVAASDLAAWRTSSPLAIDDADGPIVSGHSVVVAGLRRAPLWRGVETLLGRPLCTRGDRASCERASERADVCAARAMPVDAPSRDLRYLVALGPSELDVYADNRPLQTRVPVREYFQLLRGSGAHPIGSLAQLADAFGRVVYGDRVAASWFPAATAGAVPSWSCADRAPRARTVLGAGGGLCAVVQDGTARGPLAKVLADPRVVVYGAKTGTTDSLADVARRPAACAAWNASHPQALALACGTRPPDDSLFVITFGVATDAGTIPITLAIQLQRGGGGSAARATPLFVDAIAAYLRDGH